MTKQAKYVLFGAGAVVLMGGALVLAVVLIVGISIMAAQEDNQAAKETDKNPVSRTKTNRNDKGKTSDAPKVVGTLAPELVGVWERSDGTSQIDYTGKTQFGGGAFYTYEFSADGAVKYSMRSKVLSILQCNITENKSANGNAASDGETLTIGFGAMSHDGTNSCEASENFDETLPAETVKLKYNLKTEYDAPTLCIEESDGEHCYNRKE